MIDSTQLYVFIKFGLDAEELLLGSGPRLHPRRTCMHIYDLYKTSSVAPLVSTVHFLCKKPPVDLELTTVSPTRPRPVVLSSQLPPAALLRTGRRQEPQHALSVQTHA